MKDAFLTMAFAMAQLSKDPQTKVGCILVSPDKKQIATGFNGFPSGLPETDIMWKDRTSKDIICKHTAVLHAEENALLNARQSVAGWAAYVTHHPCVRCMALMGHAGIRYVCYSKPIKPEYQPELAKMLAEQMGIVFEWANQYSYIIPPVPHVEAKTTLESTQTDTVFALAASIEHQEAMFRADRDKCLGLWTS